MQSREVPGLVYVPEYIGEEAHGRLIQIMDSSDWLGDLRRRTQHYGYKYDYAKRGLDASMHLGALPDWAADLARRLFDEGYTDALADQAVVNEYEPGQGIAAHIDCVPCFGESIAAITLGSGCNLDFTRGEEKHSLYVAPRSLFVMRGAARYAWRHGIAARKSDVVEGVRRARGRRISLTLRKALLD